MTEIRNNENLDDRVKSQEGPSELASSQVSATVVPSDMTARRESGEVSEQATTIETTDREDPASDCQKEVIQEIAPGMSLPSSSSQWADPRNGEQPAHAKATGPRTEAGKKRSSQNSLKFGIFSRATLLNGE